MEKLVLLFALCVLPAIAFASRPVGVRPLFTVQGKVYCDTCQAGFETPVTTYIPDAKVRVECKDRKSMEVKYSQEATTDKTGTYKLYVSDDHLDQICDAVLVKSPLDNCATPSPGRDRARVILTRYNGIASESRYANAMGFTRDQSLGVCADVLKQYQLFDDDV